MSTHVIRKKIGFFSSIKSRILIFFAVFGPGVIAAVADNDAGGVATYSVVGARFGYSMMFLLLLITILLALTQEIGARMAIVTGKGLGDLIREHYGIRVSLVIFTLLLIANLGTVVANFAGIGAALELLNVPVVPFVLVTMLLMVLFIALGNFQTNQRIFLITSLLFVAYIISAFAAKPDWGLALRSLVMPTDIQFTPSYIFTALAMLGTTVTPWGQFFISSFVNDKKLSIDHLKYEQIEVFFGAFLTDLLTFFMIVAVAGTLFVNKIEINSAKEAALAIAPFAGSFSTILFGVGLLAASYMGAVIVPLTTAYAFSEFFGTEGSLDLPFSRSPLFYSLFIVQIVIACLVVFIPNVSFISIVLFTQSVNAFLLPVIIYFLLRFANDTQLMGKHTNGWFYNIFASVSGVIIAIASVFVILGSVLGYL